MQKRNDRHFGFLRSAACLALVAGVFGGAQALGAQGDTREVLVIEAGKGSTVIVLAEKPTTVAQYAAAEMQYHLEKITGEKVAVVREPAESAATVKIAVGATAMGKSLGFPVDSLAPWEFLVAEKGGTIVLAGGDDPSTEKTDYKNMISLEGKPNGTCRAVCEFLEQYCGVHWYLPSEAGMVFPQTQKLVVRMGEPIRRRTDYLSTSFYPNQVNRNMFCVPETPELTGPNVPDSDMDKWRRGLWCIPIKSTDTMPNTEVHRWLLRNKVGGEIYGPNHSFGNWLPRFGLEHPDWFSYKSKERILELLAMDPVKAQNEFQGTGKICFTAPGVFEQVVADARKFLEPPRSRGRFFAIVPNDNYNWCRCPECQALYDKPVVDCPLWGGATGRQSSYIWDFINRVAREVRKTNPDGWVTGLGYHDYMPPPKDFTLEPNVAVTFCAYLGNWTPQLREIVYGLARAWREDAKCQWIGTWEYFCYHCMNQWQPMFPKVCPRWMAEDVRNLHKLGVVAEFDESEDHYGFKDKPEITWAVWSNPIWSYLNLWMRFKMWDNTAGDVNKLLADHYHLFYGPAAKPIQSFFDRIESRVTDASLRGRNTFNDLSSRGPSVDFEYLFPPKIMKELRGYVDEATALAPDEPYKTRVGWIRMGIMEPQEKAQARYFAGKQKSAALRPATGVCYRLKTVPVIDGDGSDPAWKGLPAYYMGDWRTGEKPKAASWFRMGYDDDFLYILARCDDPEPQKIRAVWKQRDSDVFLDDCVEAHLTFDPLKSRRVQIIVNSIGAVQDFQHTLNDAGVDVSDMAWNCAGLVTAAKTDDKGFTVEMKIPLKELGGALKAGTVFYGNICREKYSGIARGQPNEIHSWSITQGNVLDDAKYFGEILLTEEDGWSLFFNQETPSPRLEAPVLFKVDKNNPWKVAPDAIRAVPDQNCIRYEMKCPAVDEKGGRTYAGFSVKMDPPVDLSKYSSVEFAFRKANPNVMMELLYNYVGEDGKDSGNYFIASPAGEGGEAPQLFTARFASGHEQNHPAPRLLKGITIYGVVEGEKTPLDCDFSVGWLRVCKDTLRGRQP